MAITDYATLKAAVLSRMDRDDLDDEFPTAVHLTDVYLQRELRTMDQEVTTTLTATGATVDLPEDCQKVLLVTAGSPSYQLRASSIAAMAQEFGTEGGQQPIAYAQTGNQLLLAPAPVDETTLSLTYVAAFTPLTESTTNWLIEKHYDIYFYGVLAHLSDHVKHEDDVRKYTGLLDTMIGSLIRSRIQDRYGSGPLVPSGMKQVSGVRT